VRLKTITYFAMMGAILQVVGAFYMTRLVFTPFLLIGISGILYLVFFACLYKNQK